MEIIGHEAHNLCECGGEFVSTGIVIDTYPPIYPHQCNKCGERRNMEGLFPNVWKKETKE